MTIIKMNRFIAVTQCALLVLGLFPPIASAQTQVKGKNVTEVTVQGDWKRPRELYDRFVFKQTKPREWQIVNVGGGAVSVCQETNRDEWSVYLYCMLSPSRTMRGYPNTGYTNSRVVLNLFKKEVTRDYVVMGKVIGSGAKPLPVPKVPARPAAKPSACRAPLVRGSKGTCLPRVYFHTKPGGLSLPEAQGIAIKNGWVIANANEVTRAWSELRLDKYAFGMLDDGRFAIPIQTNRPNFYRGTNIGVKGGNQGFFYVQKAAVARKQKRPVLRATTRSAIVLAPTTLSPQQQQQLQQEMQLSALKDPGFGNGRFGYLCNSNPGNPMLEADWQLRSEAMRFLLEKEGFPVRRLSIAGMNSHLARLRTEPVRRWQFAPFMLRVMWDALVAKSPTTAQARFRKQFEKWAACDETKIAKMTLALWNVHTGKSNAVGGVGWIGPVPGYKPNTLGVLIDTKSGRGSIEGFLPLSNPLFIGPKGRQAMNLLYKPMTVAMLPASEDEENLRPLGGEMSKTALHAGIGSGSAVTLTAMFGAAFFKQSITTVGRTMRANNAIKAKDLNKVADDLAKAGSKSAKAFKNSSKATGKLGKPITKAGAKALQKFMAGKTAKALGRTAGRHLVGKAIFAGSIVGIVALFGEVLGSVIADSVKTDQYDRQINKAATTLTDFSVTKYLGRNPSSFKRSTVFTQLVKMTIADPADNGKLSLALPAHKCGYGLRNIGQRHCLRDVKFYRQAGLTQLQARERALRNGWSLATPLEVYESWFFLGLDVYAYGRTSNGRFAVPVQRDHSNFKISPNLNATGGNQGFFYTVGKPAPPINPVGRGLVRFQNDWYKDRFVHIQINQKPEVGRILPNWASALWKLVPVGGGWVRIQSNWYKDRYLHIQNNEKPEVGRIQPNWYSAQWKLVPAGGGWVRIQSRWYKDRYLYYDAPNNKLLVGPIKPNWASARWRVR